MTGIVGHAPCTFCGKSCSVRRDKNGKLYTKCPQPPDGCGQEQWCRNAESELHLARRITRWESPEDRKQYLGDEALPAKARRAPAAEAEPEDPPEAPPEEESPPAASDAPSSDSPTGPTDAPASSTSGSKKKRRREMPQFIKDKIAARKAGKSGKRGFFDGW